MTLKHYAIDLFAGCGGLSLGLKNAGFDIILSNEINPDAAKTYKYNIDNNIIIDNISNVTNNKISKIIGQKKIDLITGGPPCQGFSMAGKRKIDDPRNYLFNEFVRVVNFVKPKFFIMENVKGLLTLNNGKAIKSIETEFKKIGYHTNTNIIKASDHGIPQHRERVFIVGSPYPFELSLTKQLKVSVKDAISDLSCLSSGESSSIYCTHPQTKFQKYMRGDNDTLHNHESPKHKQYIIDRFSKLKPGQDGSNLPRKYQTKKQILYRLDPNEPSKTITTLPDDYIHYSQDRILTVRETARLQSFPDYFKFLGKRTTGGSNRKQDVPQYSQVGNAVPPMLAKYIGKEIIKSIVNTENS